MTLAALLAVGWPAGQSPPPLEDLDQRILEDLPFRVASSAQDPWTLSLLIGVRENDLKGVAPSDLPGLSEVHNDPLLQSEHCLRGPADDGPAGDATALLSCRSFILGELASALGSGDEIDLEARTTTRVNLAFRGEAEVSVRRFGFHLGRALHALQDSHAHSFRASTDGRVRHVLNFVDHARRDDYSEVRDGHAHIAALDVCSDEDQPLSPRAQRAQDASKMLLEAVMDQEGGRAGRIARIQAVLDQALDREEGCEPGNRWCNAPELELATSCAAFPGRAAWSWPLLVLLLLAMAKMRRARASAVGLLLLLSSGPVIASEASTATSTLDAGSLGLYAGVSAAIDRGAFALAGGVRWRAFEDVSLGLDLELNPWFSIDAASLAPGVVNLYATGIVHWVAFENLELRTTAHLGTSVLLFDLVGADAGSVGLYVGLSILGLKTRLGDHWSLIFEPADLAFPIPHLRGVPYYYRQYRVSLGLQWNP